MNNIDFKKVIAISSLLLVTQVSPIEILGFNHSTSNATVNNIIFIKQVEAGMYDYYSQTEKVIKDIYKNWAQSNGLGIPDVDLRYSTYRDWDIVPPVREAEGTFYLAGNKNIEHTFSVRWRKKNNQLLRVVIDSKRIFYDEEAMWEAMDDPA